MSVTVQNNNMTTSSFDDALGITNIIPVSADSVDDSTVNSKASDSTHYLSRPDKPAQAPKLSTVTEGKETVEDVRAWAKEASFKLKSFNYKIPGDKGSPYKNRNSQGKSNELSTAPSQMVKIPSKKSVQEKVEEKKEEKTVVVVEVTQQQPEQQQQEEVVEEVTTQESHGDDEADQQSEELAGERINQENEDQQSQQQQQPRDNDEDEDQEDGEEEEGGEEDKSTAGIAAKKRAQKQLLPPVDSNTAPEFLSVNLNHVAPTLPPVPTTIESKKYHLKNVGVVPNAHKQNSGAASVSSFLNNKTKFGSRDSLSTLSHSHSQDENDGLSIQSEPLFVTAKKQKPTDRPVTPYAKLKEINKRKDYGDFVENELETYLSDEEFAKIFGKSRAEYYALPVWKQQFLKKRAQLF